MEDGQRSIYIGLGITSTVFGVVWVLTATPSNVEFKMVEGISVFAVLYVFAQAAERLSEVLIDLVSLIPHSPEKKKQEALLAVRAANSTLSGKPTEAAFAVAASAKPTEEGKVAEARTPITFLAHGVSFAFCALAVTWLNYGLMSHVGAVGVDGDLDRLLTALAAAGGTKALHELIGRLQKAKEAAEHSFAVVRW